MLSALDCTSASDHLGCSAWSISCIKVMRRSRPFVRRSIIMPLAVHTPSNTASVSTVILAPEDVVVENFFRSRAFFGTLLNP